MVRSANQVVVIRLVSKWGKILLNKQGYWPSLSKHGYPNIIVKTFVVKNNGNKKAISIKSCFAK